MSLESSLLAIAGGLVVLLFIGPAILLLLAARTNNHVRRDLPPSPRLTSATRWNFWTGGMTAWGGPIRLALENPEGMDEMSLYLRNWSRTYLGWCLGASLLTCLIPESQAQLAGLATVASFLPLFYFFNKLRVEAQTHHAPLAAAAQLSMKWFGLALGLGVVTGVAAGLQMQMLAAPFGLAAFFCVVKSAIQFGRLGLLVGIEGRSGDETWDTPNGGRDTLMAFGYVVAVLVAAVVLQLIGKALFG